MLFCMRVMVGVIILYDHVHPVGAFAKTSKIDVSTHKSLVFKTDTHLCDFCLATLLNTPFGMSIY